MQHWNIRITGRVQGVSYRVSAKHTAAQLGLKGFVRNQPDGSVYAEVEGETAALEAFAKWCAAGPPGARVDQVISEPGDWYGFSSFEIRYD